LDDDRARLAAMRTDGFASAARFHPDAIARRWREVLYRDACPLSMPATTLAAAT
jgi:uncharacterized metal-binding protein